MVHLQYGREKDFANHRTKSKRLNNDNTPEKLGFQGALHCSVRIYYEVRNLFYRE